MTQVDGARSSHPQNIDTTQKVATINDSKSDSTHQMSNPQSDDTTQQVATTVDSVSDSNYQMSTNGGSSMTQETSVTAIVLSIIFTSVLVLIILAVVIIVKLSRKINCKHRSESDGSVRSQLLLVESDGLQEDDVKFNNYNNACIFGL